MRSWSQQIFSIECNSRISCFLSLPFVDKGRTRKLWVPRNQSRQRSSNECGLRIPWPTEPPWSARSRLNSKSRAVQPPFYTVAMSTWRRTAVLQVLSSTHSRWDASINFQKHVQRLSPSTRILNLLLWHHRLHCQSVRINQADMPPLFLVNFHLLA